MLHDFYAFQLAKEVHQINKRLRVPSYIRDQFLRASSSVALNLAEGSGKRTPEDQRRFYAIALGSLRECEAILAIEEIHHTELASKNRHLGILLFNLVHPKRLKTLNAQQPKQ